MFCDTSPKDSQSESSSSSPNTMAASFKDSNSIGTSYNNDSASIKLSRSATVRRVIPHSKKEEIKTTDDLAVPVAISSEKYRRSIDSTYRRSLESISEYKTKRSFSSCLYSREGSSIDSTTSDFTDYARRHSSDTYNSKDLDKTFVSPSASYLSWLENVNSEYFGSNVTNNDIVDIDNKVGEWNNFWLNYNSPQNRYLSSHYHKLSNEEKTGDDYSDCKSTCSTHRDFNEKISSEQVVLSYDEITEIIHSAQKITDILQKAVKRNDDLDYSRNDSYYSQPSNSYSDEIPKERPYNFIDPQDLQKQKQLLKPPTQPSSCINVLLATGVADILKRVINKRREVIVPEDTAPNTARSSFTDWASSK